MKQQHKRFWELKDRRKELIERLSAARQVLQEKERQERIIADAIDDMDALKRKTKRGDK